MRKALATLEAGTSWLPVSKDGVKFFSVSIFAESSRVPTKILLIVAIKVNVVLDILFKSVLTLRTSLQDESAVRMTCTLLKDVLVQSY